MSVTDRTFTRAAASSRARGRPSRLRQMCATAGAVAVIEDEGRVGVAGPLDEQPHRVGCGEFDTVRRPGPAWTERSQRERASPAHAPGVPGWSRASAGRAVGEQPPVSSAQAATRCSQLSSDTTNARSGAAGPRAARSLRRAGPDSGCRWRRPPPRPNCGEPRGWVSPPSPAARPRPVRRQRQQQQAAQRWPRRRRPCCLTRKAPEPGPVQSTRRRDREQLGPATARSRSRPTNEVNRAASTVRLLLLLLLLLLLRLTGSSR